MLCLQLSIGAVNDLHDARADAAAGRAKPLARHRVPRPWVVLAAAAGLLVGLALAFAGGVAIGAVAVAGVLTGYAYDLVLKGTAWSWLPWALGIPLLPLFAWLGARGDVPASFVLLLPTAALAGIALAISNALVDLPLDEAAGTRSAARLLGRRASLVADVLFGAVVAIAVVSSLVAAGPVPALLAVLVGGGGIAAGARVGLAVTPDRGAARRTWEIEALGLGFVAVGWLAALDGAGWLR